MAGDERDDRRRARDAHHRGLRDERGVIIDREEDVDRAGRERQGRDHRAEERARTFGRASGDDHDSDGAGDLGRERPEIQFLHKAGENSGFGRKSTVTDRYDVVVVGAGNAALCAALAARETAGRVLVLERSGEDESGGNSRFTAGMFRVAYRGVEDLKRAMADLSPEELARSDFGTYTEEQS